MINALTELNEIFDSYKISYQDVIGAKILAINSEVILKQNHSNEDFSYFIQSLAKIEYKNDSGWFFIYGIIWLSNNRWLKRTMDYQGIEHWVLKSYPTMSIEIYS